MTTGRVAHHARSGALLTLSSILASQSGLAASVALSEALSPLGAAWIRTSCAAALIALLARPWRIRITRDGLLEATILGASSAGLAVTLMVAASRVPFATVISIAFLGPLTVAVAQSRRTDWFCPLLAVTGVMSMTQPWTTHIDPVGLCVCAAAAVFYATYVVCTQRVGDTVGWTGLAVSTPIAAVILTAALLVFEPATYRAVGIHVLLVGAGLALLSPLGPYVLELFALRRVTATAFSTIICLEPALAQLASTLILRETPDLLAITGIGLIVTAGITAVRAAARTPVEPL